MSSYTPSDRKQAKQQPEAAPRERVSAEAIAVGSGFLGTVASAASTVAAHLPGTVGLVASAVGTFATGIATWGSVKAWNTVRRRRSRKEPQ